MRPWPPTSSCARVWSARFTRGATLFVLGSLAGCYESHRVDEAEADASTPEDARVAPDAPHILDGGPDACVGEDCFGEVVAELDGLRWELPCTGPTAWDDVCATDVNDFARSATLRGAAGARYEVTLRFRGVVETKAYDGGTGDGRVRVGGTPSDTDWNVYELRVERPASTLYLNAGPDRERFCVALDEVVRVRIDAGSPIRLRADVFDRRQMKNRDARGRAIVVSGVDPAPAAFDGQFIQMDVLALERVP